MTHLIFNRAPVNTYAEVQWLNPRIRRIVARNPSAYTFTGTNTYIIGIGQVVILDPGPDLDEHFEELISATSGEHVAAITLTHRHRDHCALARRLAEYLKAPIAAYPYAASKPVEGEERFDSAFDENLKIDLPIYDGNIVQSSTPLRAIHTPGHTPDHLCFALEDDGILFSGDHVMGWSTSMIAPPLGNMAAYFASLEKLTTRGETLYYPGHGVEISNPKRFVSALIGHRKLRGQKIIELVNSGQYGDLDSLTRALYGEIDTHFFPAAMATTQAHIEMLGVSICHPYKSSKTR